MIRTILTVATVAAILTMGGPVGLAFSDAQPQQSSAPAAAPALNLNTALRRTSRNCLGSGRPLPSRSSTTARRTTGSRRSRSS
jgi:hypothetical protein